MGEQEWNDVGRVIDPKNSPWAVRTFMAPLGNVLASLSGSVSANKKCRVEDPTYATST